MADNNGSSRLVINSEALRNQMLSRRLHTVEYTTTDELSLRNKGKVADTIATILEVIPQYKQVHLENSLLSRAIGGNTPLTEIGTIMLGQQMFYNSVAHIAQQNLPVINLGNVLKWKNPITLHKNMTITEKNKDDKTFLDKVGGLVSKAFYNTNAIGESYPFDSHSDNTTFIKNTGKGQLGLYYQAINLNIYKQVGYDPSSDTIIQYGKIVDQEVTPRSTITRKFFNFSSNPYWKYSLSKNSEQAIIDANKSMNDAVNSNKETQEYAPNHDYIINNFGKTNKFKIKDDLQTFIGDESGASMDSVITNKLVWGRDGIDKNAKRNLAPLHGNTDEELANLTESDTSTFKIKSGLLEYTRNLLNATEGNFIDITRKAFKDGNEVVGFNGSPLWRANESKYARNSGIANKTGVRQHSMIDQYDRFAKTIRFKGNVVYGGSPNSVIHQTVLPRIHPTLNEDKTINNKNLMFSIENLALNCIARDSYGVIDDEWGSAIPLSEVGPFNGRIMWFPPYDLQISEVAMQRSEATVMVGRNEPMYNYQNSERTANVSFMLLIDYPEQLRNLRGENKNKQIADFFAFGGDPVPTPKKIEEITTYLKKLRDKIPETTGPTENHEPNIKPTKEFTIYFPNDMPVVGEESTIIDKMFLNPLHYEIKRGLDSAQDGNGFGLNDKIYFIPNKDTVSPSGATKWIFNENELPAGFSQYTVSGTTDYFGENPLNKALNDVFRNETDREYYEIVIDGGSSKLFLNKNEREYNLALGQRRIEAAKILIEGRLKALFNGNIAGISIVSNASTGSEGGSVEGAKPENMSMEKVKQERRATIIIRRNSKEIKPKVQNLNQQQKDDVEQIQKEIESTESRLQELKNVMSDNLFNERKKAMLNGFEAASKNNYSPAFHTQTPEDFHKRLTFLQQCTRQGAGKRYDVIDENGELRARNSVFGRQPICILRIGDFFYTKVIIDNVTVDYNDTTWDMNPEGFGMQPMIAKVTLQMKLIGGQSLKGPIDALQNAVSFNYYANSDYTDSGMYSLPSRIAGEQERYFKGIKKENEDNLNEKLKNK